MVLGNPPAAALKGAPGLKWRQTRSAEVDAYAAPGVLPEGAVLTSASGAYGHSVSEHMLALLLALMKRLPIPPGEITWRTPPAGWPPSPWATWAAACGGSPCATGPGSGPAR